jgi:hypothetical protein
MHSHVRLLIASSLACLFLLPATAAAQTEPDESTASRSGQHFIKNMKANFKDTDPADALCKGEFSAADKRKAQNLHMGIDMGLGFAEMNAKRVKGADREHPAVVVYLKKLEDLKACHKTVAARLKWLKTAGKEIKKRFFDFQGDTTDYTRTIKSLVYFAEDINDKVRKTRHPEQLEKWKADLEAIHALCTGKYKGIHNSAITGRSNERNPEMWCKTAALRQEILKRLVQNQVASTVAGTTERFVKAAAEFEQYEGYIRMDSVMEVKALNTLELFKNEVNAQHAALFAVVGMTPDPKVWTDFDAAHAALWAKVEKFAPTWKRPAKKGGGPGAKAAKKRFKAAQKGNKVKAAYITRAAWQIIKNSLGIPIRRTKPGYVVYKEATDKKWCKGRSFTYAEEWVKGKFKRSKEIKELGFIRYEKCK